MIPALDTCDPCEGTGKAGCTNYCTGSAVERAICAREHGCYLCKGTGKLSGSTGDWAVPAAPLLLGMCEHEFLDVEVEHEEDEQPVSFNPFTDHITYRTYQREIVTEKCAKCDQERTVTRDCMCESAERCKCSDQCWC